MYEFFKQRFTSFMFYVFNIIPKIMDVTSNIEKLIFFLNKWHCYVVLKKRH